MLPAPARGATQQPPDGLVRRPRACRRGDPRRARLDQAFGERSPLARVYDLGGHGLLLGAGHASNTSLHLAEHRGRWPGKRWVSQGSPLLVDGERRWVAYQELDYDAADFQRLGAAFAAETGLERRGTVGAGEGRLVPQRELVDYAVRWIEHHRSR